MTHQNGADTAVLMTVMTLAWTLFLLFLTFKVLLPLIIFKKRASLTDERQLMESLGPELDQFRCSGSIGPCNYGMGLLKMTLHQEGFRVEPLFTPAIYISKNIITKVSVIRFLGFERLKIEHNSQFVRWPLMVYLSGNQRNYKEIILSMDPSARDNRDDTVYYPEQEF